MPRATCFLVLAIVLGVFSSQLAAQPVTTVFEPVADTYLRRGTPNVSHGGSPVLEVKSSPSNNRVLVRFDLAEIAATLGQGTLLSAELELWVETNGGGWGTSGRAVDMHRVNMPWTEAGATWYCADDPMPLDNSPDCSPGWGGGSVEPEIVASALHTNDLLGPVRFDLTQELAALLAGGEHLGWSIERGAGVTGGTVFYASREGTPGRAPKLVVSYEPAGDHQPPVLSIVGPVDGALINTPSVLVTGTATDDGSVSSVVVNGLEAQIEGDAFSATVELLGNGTRPIEILATDTAGNQTTVSIGVRLDTIAPSLMWLAPADQLVTHGEEVEIRGKVEDANGVAAVTVDGVAAPFEDGGFRAEVVLVDGLNPIQVMVHDAAGNPTSQTRTVTRIVIPELAITAPPSGSLLGGSQVVVEGTVDNPEAQVSVNGVPAMVAGDGTFSTTLPLAAGVNVLTATATVQDRAATATISLARDATPPSLGVTSPPAGVILRTPSVAVTGHVNDTAGLGPVAVAVNGISVSVVNGGFLLEAVALTPGQNTIVATATDLAGNTAETQVTVRFEPPTGPRLEIVSGNFQTGMVSQPLLEPLVVRLVDPAGQPMPGEDVLFRVAEGNGVLGDGRRRALVTTDAEGRTAVQLTLGSRAGLGNHRVAVFAPGFGAAAELCASALAGAPAHLFVDAGDQQVGIASRPLAQPFIAVVTDAGFNRLEGVDVVFRVINGGGNLGGASEISVRSDALGRVSAVLTLGPEEGIANNVVWAMLGEEPEDPVAGFVATGLAAGDPAATSIAGLVLDNSDQPVPGVSLRIAGTGQTAQSDAAGFFEIAGAPVGTVHLHVDGSTAQRPGTWASLELVMTTIPGRQNTMGRPIYILPLELEQGIAVSETQGGTLRLPELPGFALEIAPGSVTFPGGGRSGVVSVTLVHNDKIPMPPNYSQQPRLVITVQPGGALFDPPARVSFPNVDGLVPGQVTELYSFDHHAGRFVSIGPAAVSENGISIESLPGFGIVEGAWHCGGDPAAAGTPHDCPECQTAVRNYCAVDPAKAEPPCEDDGDPCTVDFCDGGECMHWQKQITSVEAFGNGKKVVRILRGGRVDFEYTAETEHCSTLTQVWDFGDGVMSTVPRPSRVYNELGDFPFRVDVKCDGDCARGADGGAVVVKCPEVEITDRRPDIDYLCAGCSMQFFAETDPPGHSFSWRLAPGGDLGGKATISSLGLLVVAPDAPSGVVIVQVAVDALFSEPTCSDQDTVTIFVPPGMRPRVPVRGLDVTPGELLWAVMNRDCYDRNRALRDEAFAVMLRHWPLAQAPPGMPSCVANPNQCACDPNVGNAFLHAYMQCLVAARCGARQAEALGDAHEDYDGNVCSIAAIDLHNNDRGRGLGAGADPRECDRLVLGALARGDLVWIPPPGSPQGICAGVQRTLPNPTSPACTPLP